MGKIKVGVGGIVLLAVLLTSDRFEVLAVYIFAALLHEIGHLVAAKVLKIGVTEIRLELYGVRIVTDARLTSYKREFLLALAGPLANFTAFFVAYSMFLLTGNDFEGFFEYASLFLSGEENKWGVVGFFALASLLQAIMNLLPVQTFDGGRMIYCAIAEKLDRNSADRALSVMSAISAFLLWTVALYLMLRVSSGLGLFFFSIGIFSSVLMKK